MAELSLRRLQRFAHVTEQRRVRSTEIVPTETPEFCFRACGMQIALVQISGSQIASVATGEEE